MENIASLPHVKLSYLYHFFKYSNDSCFSIIAGLVRKGICVWKLFSLLKVLNTYMFGSLWKKKSVVRVFHQENKLSKEPHEDLLLTINAQLRAEACY